MNDEGLKELLAKYRAGRCTEEEMILLENWISTVTYPEYQISEEDLQQDLSEVRSNLPLVKTIKLWPRIAVAVSIIFILGLGFYFYNYISFREIQQAEARIGDVDPGGNKAYLTLGNGKRIVLTDANNGTIAKQSNVEIIKAADGQLIYAIADKVQGSSDLAYNIIETPKGGKYEILLPDGTHVWLNSASTLKYPASFASLKERKVELNGEAYFEVAHNKVIPFRVSSSGQTIEVLGTHFNVNSYLDEGTTKTTLLEGSVSVSLNDSKDFKLLKPGEQADKSGSHIQVSRADLEQAIGWKNGDFVFKGEDVKTVMRQLSRWYDVEVAYIGNVSDIGFVSTISRSKKLSEVIKALQTTEGVHFKIEGRRVLVMP
jgi:transmembrane sensor